MNQSEFCDAPPSDVQDRLLLRRACEQGCPEATAFLYRKFSPRLHGYLHKLTGGGNLGGQGLDDLVQDVFLQISSRKCRYSGQRLAEAFLRGVARRLLGHQRGAAGRRVKMHPLDAKSDLRIAPSSEPLTVLAAREQGALLARLIQDLPAHSKQAIQLVHVEGLRPVDAAKVAGCGPAVFRKRLQRALEALRDRAQVDL